MENQLSLCGGRFRPLAGLKQVFEPRGDCSQAEKKHPCPDCHFCQFCGDSRCHACRGSKNGKQGSGPRKLSLREQIRLYEATNAAH